MVLTPEELALLEWYCQQNPGMGMPGMPGGNTGWEARLKQYVDSQLAQARAAARRKVTEGYSDAALVKGVSSESV